MSSSDGDIVEIYDKNESFFLKFNDRSESLIDLQNETHKYKPNFKISRENLFRSADKDNIWDLFTDNFSEFKEYPCNDSMEEEVKSLLHIIKTFEDWKSKTYPLNVTMNDFLKFLERHTVNTDAQDYRIKAIQKYIKTNKNTQFTTEKMSPVHGKPHMKIKKDSDNLNPYFKSENSNVCIAQNNSDSNSIDDLLKRKKEIALNRRRILLNRKDIDL
ncbi:hypothetical protein FG386_003554 [Cryptosporidium ryanae]|uniref:uncharacterized protein n=1 Tax=Cryptosporidium ryanae TaxID=515981 RepID=UPI00351A3F18|nr:hypothetical protein FG386_003554 [Cryptosporidium ryanae]